MKVEVPKFDTRKELFDWLREKKDDIIYQKKSEFKKADEFSTRAILLKPNFSLKSDSNEEVNEFKVRAIINTTYIRDSHKDVHIDGLWNKSLKENQNIKHLEEHKMTFKNVIADKEDLESFTKTYSWKELGYDVEGKTEALVFDSNVKKSRNSTMFKEYKDGNVDNHSVGMYYLKIRFAMDSKEEEDKDLKAEYDKHIDKIANKDEVRKDGYFWAVYDAKLIEGSAVLIGSNPITPTIPLKSVRELEKSIMKVKAIEKWLKA